MNLSQFKVENASDVAAILNKLHFTCLKKTMKKAIFCFFIQVTKETLSKNAIVFPTFISCCIRKYEIVKMEAMKLF